MESDNRRTEQKRIDTFIFIEHLIGQIFALVIGLAGIGTGAFVAVHGQPAAGGTIATVAITGLAVVFITGKKKGA